MKYLTILLVLLFISCDDDQYLCGCVKTTYERTATMNPTTITDNLQSTENVICQEEENHTQIGTGNFWYRIECK